MHIFRYRLSPETFGYNVVILPVVLYGCETWSCTLKEEHRLRVFVNRVLSRIFGPKREKGAGGWRRLHNEELHNLHASPNIIRVIKSRRMRWVGHATRMGRMIYAYKILVGEPEGMRSFGRSKRNRKIILEWILRNQVGCGLDAPGSG
jgi:hypothetical protein